MSVSALTIERLVSSEGAHATTWAFSGCACGWTPKERAEGLRMAQYIAHVVEVVTCGRSDD